MSQDENAMLEAAFTEDEIKEAVFGSYAEGAPGPDGLPFLFYQKFWEVICNIPRLVRGLNMPSYASLSIKHGDDTFKNEKTIGPCPLLFVRADGPPL